MFARTTNLTKMSNSNKKSNSIVNTSSPIASRLRSSKKKFDINNILLDTFNITPISTPSNIKPSTKTTKTTKRKPPTKSRAKRNAIDSYSNNSNPVLVENTIENAESKDDTKNSSEIDVVSTLEMNSSIKQPKNQDITSNETLKQNDIVESKSFETNNQNESIGESKDSVGNAAEESQANVLEINGLEEKQTNVLEVDEIKEIQPENQLSILAVGGIEESQPNVLEVDEIEENQTNVLEADRIKENQLNVLAEDGIEDSKENNIELQYSAINGTENEKEEEALEKSETDKDNNDDESRDSVDNTAENVRENSEINETNKTKVDSGSHKGPG